MTDPTYQAAGRDAVCRAVQENLRYLGMPGAIAGQLTNDLGAELARNPTLPLAFIVQVAAGPDGRPSTRLAYAETPETTTICVLQLAKWRKDFASQMRLARETHPALN